MRKAFDSLNQYQQDKSASHDLEIQARTHHNIQLKQKTFFYLKIRARSKAQNKEAIMIFAQLTDQGLKKKVWD